MRMLNMLIYLLVAYRIRRELRRLRHSRMNELVRGRLELALN